MRKVLDKDRVPTEVSICRYYSFSGSFYSEEQVSMKPLCLIAPDLLYLPFHLSPHLGSAIKQKSCPLGKYPT
jgi:hypothetical protein